MCATYNMLSGMCTLHIKCTWTTYDIFGLESSVRFYLKGILSILLMSFCVLVIVVLYMQILPLQKKTKTQNI